MARLADSGEGGVGGSQRSGTGRTKNGTAERKAAGAETIRERRLQQVAVGMGMVLIVTAGEDFAIGGDDAAAPKTPTGIKSKKAAPQRTEQRFAAAVEAVTTTDIAGIAGTGRHKRVTVSVVGELSRLQGEAICPQRSVGASESRPLVLVGAKAEALQLDGDATAVALLRLVQPTEGVLGLAEAASLAVSGI